MIINHLHYVICKKHYFFIKLANRFKEDFLEYSGSVYILFALPYVLFSLLYLKFLLLFLKNWLLPIIFTHTSFCKKAFLLLWLRFLKFWGSTTIAAKVFLKFSATLFFIFTQTPDKTIHL